MSVIVITLQIILLRNWKWYCAETSNYANSG